MRVTSKHKSPIILQKLLRIEWPLFLVICAIAMIGFLMLYSVADGSLDPWARNQIVRFGLGAVAMLIVAVIDIRVFRWIAPIGYLTALGLLAAVEIVGMTGLGAQRWIRIGSFGFQPSEPMKLALVLALARFYSWLDADRVSRPLWLLPPLGLIALPTILVLRQPDLGTAILLSAGGMAVVFFAGVSWWYFATVGAAGGGAVWAVMASQGTGWQILKDYQYRRIETFLDPSADPLGAGYHIIQSKIAMGSGGVSGRGFMQGTQNRLNFLPEKHTDFIFTVLSEEFGFTGSILLLALYITATVLGFAVMIRNTDRFGALVTGGLIATFSFHWITNLAMVTGLVPVVGVPLPLVSYGGSAMLVLLVAFGLVQSVHVHRS